MLACSTIPNVADITYPVLASPKLDGIRCLIINGVPVSRNLKPIPNLHIRNTLLAMNLPPLDGELMVDGDFNSVQSAVMSEHGCPDFRYVAFDYILNPPSPYAARLRQLGELGIDNNIVQIIETVRVLVPSGMQANYDMWLNAGYEGAIVRAPDSPYKYGRSTLKQGWMLKLKHFDDAEAEIVGLEELHHNENEATKDALGHTVRSSHKDQQVAGDTLGSLVVTFNGTRFKIGTGFDSAERSRLWHLGDKLLGRHVTFKYQELSKYGVPRFPVYKGLRAKGDM